MEAKLFHSLTTKPPLPTGLSLPKPSATAAAIRRPPRLKLGLVNSGSGGANGSDAESNAAPQPQITAPPEAVEVRFRRRSKRRPRQPSGGDGDGRVAKAVAGYDPPAKKKWEDMSVAEKAVELYVGERGALYWLNKLAYAAIFVVIGGWIVFRFVGPALDLYQLDSAPLSPDSLFKGSS